MPLSVDDIERLARAPLQDPRHQEDARIPTGTFAPMNAADLLNEPAAVQAVWVWEEFLAEGSLGCLVAKPKVGKTTNAYELAIKVAQGLPYLGRATRRGAVLILALEEHRREVKQRLIHLGADQVDEIHVHVGPLAHSPDTFHAMQQFIAEHRIVLVILDTLNTFWSVQDENDAVAVTQAIKPILNLARTSEAAILLLHHARKSEGEHGDEIRGSGALFSLLDVALILKRHEIDTQRKLMIVSRYPDTPRELIIELRDHGHEALGDPTAVGKAAKIAKVRAALTDVPTAAAEIGKRAGVSRGGAYSILDRLVDQGLAQRTGTGKRNDPYRYFGFVSVFPLRQGGPNETKPDPASFCGPGSEPGDGQTPFVSFAPLILRVRTKTKCPPQEGDSFRLPPTPPQTKRNGNAESESAAGEEEVIHVD